MALPVRLKSMFLLVLTVSFLCSCAAQSLPVDAVRREVRARRTQLGGSAGGAAPGRTSGAAQLTAEERDMVLKLGQHPQLFYSEFMAEESALLIGGLSDSCSNDVWRIIQDLMAREMYALRMVDSFGKPGPAFLDGNVHWLGSYEECKAVQNVTFQPQYCLPKVMAIITVGVCVPSSCNETDVKLLVDGFLGTLNFSLPTSDVHCVTPVPWRAGDTAMVVVIALFGLIVLCSTLYEFAANRRAATNSWTLEAGSDANGAVGNVKLTSRTANGSAVPTELHPNGIHTVDMKVSTRETNGQVVGESNGNAVVVQQPRRPRPEDKSASASGVRHDVLSSFSLVSNIHKLCTMDATPRGMEALNGVRVLSMAWVILGHTYVMLLFYGSNLTRVFGLSSDFWFQFILWGDVSMDTFFFMSGFLVAFGTLKLLKKNRGRLNWGLFYLHRYLRLTPTLLFVMCLWMTIFLHFISGPNESFERMDTFFFSSCYEHWWTVILYINNLYFDNTSHCIGWSWYLACDMQFYIVSPIFIYALYRNRKVGYSLIGLGILSNLLAVGIMFNKYDLSLPNDVSNDVDEKVEGHIYQRPYYRIAPYLVGIACADIYMATKDTVKNLRATWWKVFVWVAWAAAIAMNWALLYGMHPHLETATLSPQWLNDLYKTTFRLVWSLIIAWITYACFTGWGGPINRLLSLPVWEPLVRLCYLLYLCHIIVMTALAFNLQQTIFLNNWIMAYLFVAFLGITLGVSVGIFLVVEQPLGRLQRTLLKK